MASAPPLSHGARVDRRGWGRPTSAVKLWLAVGCPGEAMTLTGRLMDVDKDPGEKLRRIWCSTTARAGPTLSGGEPLAQAQFAMELPRRYKQAELGATWLLRLSGAVLWRRLRSLAPV